MKNPKKVIKPIFLDFDGVIWTIANEHAKKRLYEVEPANVRKNIREKMDPIACANVQWILDQVPEAVIVVSSSWRMGRSIGELRKILKKSMPYLEKRRVIGKTEIHGFSRIRGREIVSWLENARKKFDIPAYVILDDDSDMRDDQLENFIQTDTIIGLTAHDAARAAFILGDRENIDLLSHRNWMIKRLLKTDETQPKLTAEIEAAIEAKREERRKANQERVKCLIP